jgi:effector-binding domain-containing protein
VGPGSSAQEVVVVDVVLVDETERPTAGLREEVPMAGLTDFFGRAFTQVARVLQAQGQGPAGPAFALYRGRPGPTVDVEAGFPVAGPLDLHEPVVAGRLPAGRCVEAVHEGSYDALEQTYVALEHWMDERGLEPSDEMWEEYLSGPDSDPDPSTWRTRVVWPVR